MACVYVYVCVFVMEQTLLSPSSTVKKQPVADRITNIFLCITNTQQYYGDTRNREGLVECCILLYMY